MPSPLSHRTATSPHPPVTSTTPPRSGPARSTRLTTRPAHPPQRLASSPPAKSESIDWHQRRLPRPGLAHLPRPTTIPQRSIRSSSGPRRPVQPPPARAGPAPCGPTLGYFVFEPNPRGSFGQGEKFTQANLKDFGYGDLRDILAGVDASKQALPHRQGPRRHHRLELRRLHDHVRRHPDPPLPRRRRRRRHLQLAELLRRELHRPVDDSRSSAPASTTTPPSTPSPRPSTSSSTSRLRPWSSSATATANAPRRRASSSGMRCATRASRPNSSSTPTKATASATPNTFATGMNARFAGLRRTCPPANSFPNTHQTRPALLFRRLAALLFRFPAPADDSCTPYLLADRPTPKLETRKFSQLTVLPFSFRSG